MSEKYFISAQQLLDDSFRLGLEILDSDFRPDFIVGVWRGGTPVGIVVQELLDYFGVVSDHIAIRTSSYEGIGKRSHNIRVHGLNYIVKNVNAEHSLLIVDALQKHACDIWTAPVGDFFRFPLSRGSIDAFIGFEKVSATRSVALSTKSLETV